MSAEPIITGDEWTRLKGERPNRPAPARGLPMLHIDFETRGIIDLRRVGADRYAADPDTGIWCMAWAIGDDPVSIWHPGDPDPHPALEHIETGGIVAGWNIAFEFAIWQHVIARSCPHWPSLDVEQLDCTMARSYARACPGQLGQAAIAVNVPFQKDSTGHRLMLRMCKPTTKWQQDPTGPPEWHQKPDELARLGAYCIADADAERALSRRLAPLTPNEHRIWLMDWDINRRGVAVDEPKVRGALRVCEAEKKRLNDELKTLTEGHVSTVTQVPNLLAWLKAKGIETENLKKRPLLRLLRSDAVRYATDPDVVQARRAIEIRLEAAKASTAKLKAMLDSRDTDGRCRGLFSYHVATTGRWAGRRIQLQNFPRPAGLFGDDAVGEAEIESCIELFDDPDAIDLIRICYANPIPAVSSCLRGLLVPGEGNKFVGGDFTGIENRTLMWCAGEDWQLDEFRKFDRGEGTDAYKLTYSKAFGVTLEDVTSKQRMIGKVASLACGYNGAVGAYMNMGDNYDDFTAGDVARAAREATDPETWERITAMYPSDEQEQWRFGLDLETWTGIRCVVEAWRASHPNVVRFWDDLTRCATAAVCDPKKVKLTQQRKIKFIYDGHFLFMQLPSGRPLAYARPEAVEAGKWPDGSPRHKVMYWGLGKKTKRWEKRGLTASILSENAASGTARDVLTDAMLRLEARGYPIRLHVHDEAVSEVPKAFGSVEEFRAIMCDSAKWLDGIPIAAKAWEGERFRK